MGRGTPTLLSCTPRAGALLPRAVALLAVPLLAITLLARTAAAQQDATTTPTLPAEALTFAAALEEKAPPKLLDWAKKQARAVLRKEFSAGELSPEKFAALFPDESPQVRDALRFLAGYQAYRRASEQQELRASRLRDLDREIRELAETMRMIENTGAPIGSIAADQRNFALAVGQRRMEDLELQRKLVTREQTESNQVDACLRWLADAYPRVKDTPADALRSTPPPRN